MPTIKFDARSLTKATDECPAIILSIENVYSTIVTYQNNLSSEVKQKYNIDSSINNVKSQLLSVKADIRDISAFISKTYNQFDSTEQMLSNKLNFFVKNYVSVKKPKLNMLEKLFDLDHFNIVRIKNNKLILESLEKDGSITINPDDTVTLSPAFALKLGKGPVILSMSKSDLIAMFEGLGYYDEKFISELRYQKALNTDWREILSKDANDITNEEYLVLADTYLKMKYENCGEFLSYFYNRTSNLQDDKQNVHNAIITLNYAHSEFSINKDKMQKFQFALAIYLSEQYKKMNQTKNSNINISQPKDIYQETILKNAFITSILKKDKLYNTYDSLRPLIFVNNPSGNRYKYISIDYYDFKEQDLKYLSQSYIDLANKGHIVKKEIIFSSVLDAQKKDYTAQLSIELDRSCRKFFNICTSEKVRTITDEFIASTLQDEIIDSFSENVSKICGKLAGKAIPLGYDFVMTLAEYEEAKQKRITEINYYSSVSSLAQQSFIYDRMELYAVSILNDDDNVCSFYIQPGIKTQELINKYNDCYGEKYGRINMDDLLNGNKNVYDSLIKANSDATK